MNLTIAELKITPIAIGDPPLLNAAGLHAPFAIRIVIELISEHGVSGLGEIPGSSSSLAALRKVAPRLIGRNAWDVNSLLALLEGIVGDDDDARGNASWDRRILVHIYSVIEVASLDLIGKTIGCRVADLLGGPRREKVGFAGYLFFKYEGAGGIHGFGENPSASGTWPMVRQRLALGPDEIVVQAEALVEEYGFASLKLKAGILDPNLECDSVIALHDRFGDEMPLRIDPNAVWSFETALKQGNRLMGKIDYYEDPVRGQEAMAELRRQQSIPLATNMCTTRFADIPGSIRLGSEDIILSDHHFWGGLRASVELARLCQTFGRGLCMHSNSHAGISLAAMVQLGAVVPDQSLAFDTHYPWQSDDVISGGRLEIRDGQITLPDAPGLGVTLDREALAKAAESYTRCGITDRNDEKEMQARNPDWKFLQTRS